MKLPINLTVALVSYAMLAGAAFTKDDQSSEKSPKDVVDANQSQKEQEDKENAPPLAKPKTHKVERKTFQLKVILEGVLESAKMEEVSIPSKLWGELLVLDALPQGTKVNKGESLISLDMEKIDEKIRSARHELTIIGLDREIIKADLKLAEIVNPLELATLERKNKETQEDLIRHQKINRPFSEKAAAFNLKSYQESLAYAQEELKQLKKMYEADDLTEETEEIILRRAENAVERSTFALDGAKIRNEETLRFRIPREDVDLKESAKRSALALQVARKTKPAELEKKRLEGKKLEHQREKAAENLERLQGDRKAMQALSPSAGIVYHGTFDRGKWSGPAPLKTRLRRGGALKPHEVFMTIVAPRPLFIRTAVAEKDFRKLKEGAKGKVKTIAFPDLEMEGKIREISSFPVAPNKFDVLVDVSLPKGTEQLLPGMSCKIEIISYRKENALVVPSTAVFSDEEESGDSFVYLHRKGKKPSKRTVKTGKQSGDQTEILEGIKPGMEILAEKPKR